MEADGLSLNPLTWKIILRKSESLNCFMGESRTRCLGQGPQEAEGKSQQREDQKMSTVAVITANEDKLGIGAH